MTTGEEAVASEVTDLLQHLVRNACVNDGTSAAECRNADLLRSYLDPAGLDIETFEPAPARRSLVARIEGRRSDAPSLLLMGHTDVVPATAGRWSRDPFAGDLVDGWVWGRGAIDMLNLTASMAVAIRRLSSSGWSPSGTLVYLAVADEEALGGHGAGWLVGHARDAVAADYVITESGGIPLPTPGGKRLPVIVGEKGSSWSKISVQGTPGHASQPFRTDNALVKAAEVVRRIAEYRPPARIDSTWRSFVQSLELPPDLAASLVDPNLVTEACEALPAVGFARQAHACTHTTFAPTMARSGTKINVIPDSAEIEVDIRTLPGDDRGNVARMLEEALGELRTDVQVATSNDHPASVSPAGTPLWDALQRMTSRFHPGSRNVPFVTAGATDARFYRGLGIPSYGFGMFSNEMTLEQYGSMFHGDDERVDVESLKLSALMWERLARDFLS